MPLLGESLRCSFKVPLVLLSSSNCSSGTQLSMASAMTFFELNDVSLPRVAMPTGVSQSLATHDVSTTSWSESPVVAAPSGSAETSPGSTASVFMLLINIARRSPVTKLLDATELCRVVSIDVTSTALSVRQSLVSLWLGGSGTSLTRPFGTSQQSLFGMPSSHESPAPSIDSSCWSHSADAVPLSTSPTPAGDVSIAISINGGVMTI